MAAVESGVVSNRGEPALALEGLGVPASDVKPLTFGASRANRTVQLGARVCVGLAGVAILAWGARHGVDWLLVSAAVLVGPVLWVVTRPGWQTGWRVAVSDQYIEVTRYGGRRIRLKWDEVGEVQHFVRKTARDPVRVLRLLSLDRQRDVIVDDRLVGFQQLIDLIESKIRHVDSGTPSSWGRLLWAGHLPI